MCPRPVQNWGALVVTKSCSLKLVTLVPRLRTLSSASPIPISRSLGSESSLHLALELSKILSQIPPGPFSSRVSSSHWWSFSCYAWFMATKEASQKLCHSHLSQGRRHFLPYSVHSPKSRQLRQNTDKFVLYDFPF